MPDPTIIYVVLITYKVPRTMRLEGDILQRFAFAGRVVRNDYGFYETTERFGVFVDSLRRQEGLHV